MSILLRLAAVCACLAILGGQAALLVWTFPVTAAGWYWYVGQLLFAIPAAILILHAGVQQCVPPAR